MSKISFLAGAALGYVLGARAGRGQYEKMRVAGRRAWDNPRVQGGVQKVESTVRQQAPVVADKVAEVAKDKGGSAGAKVSGAVQNVGGKVTGKRADKSADKNMHHDSETLPEPPPA